MSAALFCGVGIDSVAAKYSGFRTVFAAETDPQRREAFYANTGVEPAVSNAALFAAGLPELPAWRFGFVCAGFSQSGTNEGRQHESWPDFLAAMTALMATCFKSRCDEINCFWGAMKCHRMIPPVPPRPESPTSNASETAQENL